VRGEVANVFVVDDDAAVRRALGRLLRSAGYQPETFSSAEHFLKGSHLADPGCILVDIKLPGLNGLELQQTLIDAKLHFGIVFITGQGDVPMSVRAMKAGAVDFLSKPFNDEELLQAVAQALNNSRREQSEQEEAAEILTRLSTLTAREREVLGHVVAGQLNKQVAADLGVVEKTIKVHRARLMDKMGTSSLAELVTMAVRIGLPAPLHLKHASPRTTGNLRFS
jgi:FixJ family two-component response regulator